MTTLPAPRILGFAFAAVLLSATALTAIAQDSGAPGATPPDAAGSAPPVDPLDEILKNAQPLTPDAGGADAAGPGADAPAAAEGLVPEADTPAAATAPTPPGPPESTAVEIIPPGDPVARAAFDILDLHCAHCHQAGKLTGGQTKPKADFGNVLHLDQIAADPHLITPGNPDGSFMMKQILSGAMPDDSSYNIKNPPLNPDEIAALRTWITGLGAVEVAGCGREFITDTAMADAMLGDIGKLQDTRVADTRYITLTHLYNACASDEEMEVFRQGTVKLLNSLSHVSDVVRLETVDPAGTIIRFNLKDVGWDPEDWSRILAVYPYAAKPDSPNFDFVAASTLTELPYVRGDWFAFTAAQPPLYNTLLRLPGTLAELEQKIGANVNSGIEQFLAKRAGFQQSGVSQNNRLIERHQIPTGYFWTSYDFGGNRENQSLFEFPLGPGTTDTDFHHDGGETIFSLPNGFQGYYLNKADGAVLDKGPTQIVRDTSRKDLTVTNGISCMGCHDLGMKLKQDEIRDHVLATRTFTPGVRDAVEALYPPKEEMDAILRSDMDRFTSAMIRAGLKPELKLGGEQGVEMINALAKKYENDVDLTLAAAEFGQDRETFMASLEDAGSGEVVRMKRRLDQGLIPRDTFEAQFADFIEVVSDNERVDLTQIAADVGTLPVAQVAGPAAASGNFDLSLISDRSTYKVGELPVFTVTPAHDCYLTLINVDAKNFATVLYPNQYQQDNFLKAGKDFHFPAADAPFQYRFADPGAEKVIAVCGPVPTPADDIKLDFKGGAFAEVGDYEKQIAAAAKTRQIKIEQKIASGDTTAAPVDPVSARAAIQLSVQ
jgi:hypothetical protein